MLMLEDKYGKLMNILNKHIRSKAELGTYDCDDVCPEAEDMRDYVHWHGKKLNLGDIKVANGVSKIALVSDTLDYVLKVPMLGRFYERYDDNTQDDEDKYYSEFEEFQYGSGAFHNDYCQKEVDIYWCAVEHGVDMLFAKTEFFDVLNCGLTVYKQPRVVPYNDSETKTASPAALATVKSNDNYKYAPCCEEWKALVIDFYGQEILDKFLDFIDNICPEVREDLHRGNYGYTLDGRPILLDYSGWGDC